MQKLFACGEFLQALQAIFFFFLKHCSRYFKIYKLKVQQLANDEFYM